MMHLRQAASPVAIPGDPMPTMYQAEVACASCARSRGSIRAHASSDGEVLRDGKRGALGGYQDERLIAPYPEVASYERAWSETVLLKTVSDPVFLRTPGLSSLEAGAPNWNSTTR